MTNLTPIEIVALELEMARRLLNRWSGTKDIAILRHAQSRFERAKKNFRCVLKDQTKN